MRNNMLVIGCFVWLWEILYLSKQNVGPDALIKSTKDGRHMYLTNVTLKQFCSKNTSNIPWYLLAILSGTYFIKFYYKCLHFVSFLNPGLREKCKSFRATHLISLQDLEAISFLLSILFQCHKQGATWFHYAPLPCTAWSLNPNP